MGIFYKLAYFTWNLFEKEDYGGYPEWALRDQRKHIDKIDQERQDEGIPSIFD